MCHALRVEHTHEGVPTANGETTITATPVDGDASEYVIDPWPFRDEAVTLVYEGRRLAGRFAEEETMRAALRRAPWLTLTTRLRPAIDLHSNAPKSIAERTRLSGMPQI